MNVSIGRINAKKALTLLVISSLLVLATPQFAALPGGISGASVGGGFNFHGAVPSEDGIGNLECLRAEVSAGETFRV